MPPSRRPRDPFSIPTHAPTAPNRSAYDPFYDAPPPTSTRALNNLFRRDDYPKSTRRRATARTDEADILADDSAQGHPQRRQIKHTRTKPVVKNLDEHEFVVRKADGSYLLDAPRLSGDLGVFPPEKDEVMDAEEAEREELARMAAWSRQYFATGRHMQPLTAADEEYTPQLMAVLREAVKKKLEEDRWKYEAAERF